MVELKPGYKQTEVGVIPEEWDAKEIGGEIDLLTGHPFPSSGYTESGVRLLRGSNVKRGETDWNEDITQYWPTVSPNIARYELRRGDLVIAMDGSLVGRSFAQLKSEDLPALLLQRVARIRSTKLDVSYLTALVSSERFVRYADSVKTVTAIPHISPGDIRKFTIPLPPSLPEQRAIATALSDVDALLAGLDRLIAKKRDLKQAAMQQLLTGQTRLGGFATGGKKRTEFGIIPEDWDIAEVFDLDPFITSGSRSWAKHYSENGSLFMRITNLSRGCIYPDLADQKFVDLPQNDTEGFRTALRNGDILISITADIGIIGYVNDRVPKPAYINQHIACLRLPAEKVNSQFQSYFLASREPQKRFAEMTDVGAKSGINLTTIGKLKLLLPPLPEQTAIAAVLSDMDAELTALQSRRDKTHALKQAMMQELLTGKTRLV